MTTLDDIKAAVDKLTPTQQDYLTEFLEIRRLTRPRERLTPQETAARLLETRGLADSGVTTEEYMELMRGEG